MALFQPADDLFLVVVWSSQTAGPRYTVGRAITGCDDDQAIMGDDVPSNDPIKIQAGAACSVPWIYNGTTSLDGKALIFTARDMALGTIITQKINAAGGGSEDDFTTPPLGDDGLPTLDSDGKRMPGFINLHGMDTRTFRRAVHKYDVRLEDPADMDDPTFPSDSTFEITEHANP